MFSTAVVNETLSGFSAYVLFLIYNGSVRIFFPKNKLKEAEALPPIFEFIYTYINGID